jgi:hypothetical protein
MPQNHVTKCPLNKYGRYKTCKTTYYGDRHVDFVMKQKNDYECGIECGLPCNALKVVMHGF